MGAQPSAIAEYPPDPDDAPLTQTKFKIVVVGAPGAGSTCVFKRFIDGQYAAKHVATEQAGVGVKSIRLRECSTLLVAEVWDLPGAALLSDLGTPHSLGDTFFADVHGVIFVYDLEDPARSAHALSELQRKIKEHHPLLLANALPLLLANKHDAWGDGNAMRAGASRRAARQRGVVLPDDGSDNDESSSDEENEVDIPGELYTTWTPACIATHCSVSAKLNYGIHAAFNDLVCRIYEETDSHGGDVEVRRAPRSGGNRITDAATVPEEERAGRGGGERGVGGDAAAAAAASASASVEIVTTPEHPPEELE